MKVATIIFERVRDCPHWNEEGECYKQDDYPCNKNELDLPPIYCPLEDIEDCK